MRAVFRSRLRLILALILFISVLIIARLYFVEIVHGRDYALKADHQYQAGSSSLFDRGSVYFTQKDGTLISAATLATGFLVAINPNLVSNPQSVYATISSVAPGTIDHDAFFKAAGNHDVVYVEVAHHLNDAQGKALATKKIAGVSVLRERWVNYPGGNLASQSIGLVGFGSGDMLSGQTGLEAEYDSTLAREGNGLYTNFFAELFANLGNIVVNARNAREGNIVTTIEPELETRLMDDLAAVNAKYSSQESGGIIMDTATGAIYALGDVPTYNANDLSNATPAELGNPLVEHVYEFGSIMKPLTMASGIDSGVITATSTYNDTGCITVDTARICNYDLKARGVIPMQQILSQSLNVGASWIATQLGPTLFRHYFTGLFGTKTGIDLPSEQGNLLANLKSPRQVEYDNMSFGQGIAVTPIAMIRALDALANHGQLVRPHLTREIILDSGITRTLDWSQPTSQEHIFSASAATQVSTMLTVVVDTKISNGKEKIPSMTVAAKTGTAQLTMPGGGYYQNKYFHSFFGFFPAYNPRFIILLYTKNPQGVEYASETLTATFFDLVHFLIDYYAVPPDRAQTS